MGSKNKPREHLTQYTFLKKGVSVYDFLYMHPALLAMYAFVLNFCQINGVKCVVTSIYRPPNDGISKSRTHQSMRAFDLSLRQSWGWSDSLIEELKNETLKNFRHVGAISRNSGESKPIYVHRNSNGNGRHAHFQVRPGL